MVHEPPRQHRATLFVLIAMAVLIVGSLVAGLVLSR